MPSSSACRISSAGTRMAHVFKEDEMGFGGSQPPDREGAVKAPPPPPRMATRLPSSRVRLRFDSLRTGRPGARVRCRGCPDGAHFVARRDEAGVIAFQQRGREMSCPTAVFVRMLTPRLRTSQFLAVDHGLGQPEVRDGLTRHAPATGKPRRSSVCPSRGGKSRRRSDQPCGAEPMTAIRLPVEGRRFMRRKAEP